MNARFGSLARKCWPIALAALLLPQACGGPTFVVAQYDGPVRPRGTIAILRQEGADSVQMIAVDGEALAPIDKDARLHIEVLPGPHSVAIANLAQRGQPAQRVRFIAEPGKLYGPSWADSGPPRVFELDASSGAKLRDVSQTQPEARAFEAARPVAPPPAPLPPPAPSAPPAAPADAAPPPLQVPAADAAPR